MLKRYESQFHTALLMLHWFHSRLQRSFILHSSKYLCSIGIHFVKNSLLIQVCCASVSVPFASLLQYPETLHNHSTRPKADAYCLHRPVPLYRKLPHNQILRTLLPASSFPTLEINSAFAPRRLNTTASFNASMIAAPITVTSAYMIFSPPSYHLFRY